MAVKEGDFPDQLFTDVITLIYYLFFTFQILIFNMSKRQRHDVKCKFYSNFNFSILDHNINSYFVDVLITYNNYGMGRQRQLLPIGYVIF